MDIIQRLPDDIIIKIYTKILRKYRFHKGKLIKLIDFEKYKFLEKFISRRIVKLSKLNFDNNIDSIIEIKYTLPNLCELPDRKEQLIDDDMMYLFLTIKENTVSYIIQRFRFKKIEDLITKNKPSIYHRGNNRDYDWEMYTYIYQI